MEKYRLCLIKGCGKEKASRGLCSKCYTAACRIVNDGQATWEFLVSKGLARKSKTEESRSGFMTAFRKIKPL